MRCLRHGVPLAAILISLSALLAGPGEAQAQTTCAAVTQPPWPDGCSLLAPLFVKNGLDDIFFGACDQHDLCWAECNGPTPPYLGLDHKAQCDLAFLDQMGRACVFWATRLAYPASGWLNTDDFLEDCSAVAAALYAGVNTPVLAFNIFWRSQCCRGCNPNGCTSSALPLPFLCGRGQCWGSLPRPKPEPIPLPLPCLTYAKTETWVLGASGEPAAAAEQLGFALQKYERRPESAVYLEEWAVVSPSGEQPFVSLASSNGFKDRVAASAKGFSPAERGVESVLVVEAAVHEHNERYAPTPAFEPFVAPLAGHDAAKPVEPQSFWFRAEVDAAGRVDRVDLLDTSASLPRESVAETIRANLRLRYADERRHRNVVYARGSITPDGVLKVEHGLVVPAMCCTYCCYVSEFGWMCPCY